MQHVSIRNLMRILPLVTALVGSLALLGCSGGGDGDGDGEAYKGRFFEK